MNRDRKILAGVLCVAFVLSSAPPFFSQQKQPAEGVMIYQREKVVQDPEGGRRLNPPSLDDAYWFVTSEMSFEGKLVKGAPYSAQAVTEMTQTLSDGNRIVNKSTVSVYRDSEGRTRREETLRAIGPFATGEDQPQMIFISDPVAGTSYTLDTHTHVARKTSPMRFNFKIKEPAPGTKIGAPGDGSAPQAGTEPGQPKVFVMTTQAGPGGEGEMSAPRVPGGDVLLKTARVAGGQGGLSFEVHGNEHKNAREESLGKQSVEGVDAEGSRTTITIPAGEIGNDRAIEIVNERWYSPELKTTVMTRHSDPRFGETVYRLTNINRGEQPKSLFEVPADYTIKEKPDVKPGTMPMRKLKPVEEEQ